MPCDYVAQSRVCSTPPWSASDNSHSLYTLLVRLVILGCHKILRACFAPFNIYFIVNFVIAEVVPLFLHRWCCVRLRAGISAFSYADV
jgi:hypothetical protein